MLHDRLRRACREDDGRAPEPTAGCVDSQSLRAAEVVGADRRGYDGGNYQGSDVMPGRAGSGWLMVV